MRVRIRQHLHCLRKVYRRSNLHLSFHGTGNDLIFLSTKHLISDRARQTIVRNIPHLWTAHYDVWTTVHINNRSSRTGFREYKGKGKSRTCRWTVAAYAAMASERIAWEAPLIQHGYLPNMTNGRRVMRKITVLLESQRTWMTFTLIYPGCGSVSIELVSGDMLNAERWPWQTFRKSSEQKPKRQAKTTTHSAAWRSIIGAGIITVFILRVIPENSLWGILLSGWTGR